MRPKVITTSSGSARKLPIPSELLVMGVKFRVQMVDSIDDEGSIGETIGDLRLIKISSTLDSRRRWTTLWHEYLHACLYVVGIGNEMDVQIEEVIVQTLEHGGENFMLLHGSDFLQALESQK